jgi:molybdenum cofactor cytidylyltransferase
VIEQGEERPETAVAAVVLAAGLSRRMGRPKLLEDLDGEPVIRRTASEVLRAGLEPVVGVVGPDHHAAFRDALHDLEVRIVTNPSPESGQSSSLRVGLEALPASTAAALIVLGDQPQLPPEVIPRLLHTFRESGASIAAPRYSDGRGNPVLFRSGLFAELTALTGDQGARSVIDRDQSRVCLVAFDRPMPADIDTPEDLAALRNRRRLDPGRGVD